MTKSWIATPSRTNAILNRYQLDAKKSLGQNFLMEPQILEKMVEAAAIDQETDVIEIGP
ncbi:16S rRNA (adenine(1518)-N(6)/adenine(1519)-N(6))-dimethyltransferase, partial [Streptococcus anginosus]